MKLLFTSFTYAPQANGVAEVVTRQAEGLAARGHDVTVATGMINGRRSTDRGSTVTVEEFALTGGLQDDPLERERYTRFVAEFQGDAILAHCWNVWSTDLALPALQRQNAIRLLISHGYGVHWWHRRPRFPWGLGEWIRRWPAVLYSLNVLRALDHIVFLSPRCDWNRFIDHMLVSRLGKPHSSVIPNGANPDQFVCKTENLRAKYGLGSGPIILSVAAYVPNKNPQLALNAFLDVAAPEMSLVFIGNEHNNCSRELIGLAAIRRNGNGPQVLCLEKLTREEINSFYAAADLFLLTSEAETAPLSVLDAMASGTPWICSNVGCVNEWPGGIVGRNRREIAAALARLLESSEQRHALGVAGITACRQQFQWNAILDKYERLLAELISRQER